jgi:hypothetical protein
VAKVKLASISVNVGAPTRSFETNCHRAWVPRWKPLSILISVMGIFEASADFRVTAGATSEQGL